MYITVVKVDISLNLNVDEKTLSFHDTETEIFTYKIIQPTDSNKIE